MAQSGGRFARGRRRWHGTALTAILVLISSPAGHAAEPPGEPDLATVPVKDTGQAGDDTARLETIEVIGSRIRRVDRDTAQPVRVIPAGEVEASGVSAIGDLLRRMPQAGPSPSRAINFGGTGASQVSLRSLGSSRVLVLVNGRRWVGGVGAYAHAPIDIAEVTSTSVDLNTIPLSIIDEVEVLSDGASAIYGTDALAGVINIKTRSAYVGTELKGHLGVTEHGDGWTRHLSVVHGSLLGSGSAFVSVSYESEGRIVSADRPQSSVPVLGTGVSRGLPASPQGRFAFLPLPGNPGIPADERCYDIAAEEFNRRFLEGSGAGVAPLAPAASPIRVCDMTRDPGNGGVPQPDFVRWDQNVHALTPKHLDYLMTPSERAGVYSQFARKLAPGLEGRAELFYHHRTSRQQFGEPVLAVGDLLGPPFDLAYVDQSNPYNPFGQDIGRRVEGEVPYALGIVLRRVTELGPRSFEQSVDSYRIGLGLDSRGAEGPWALDWDSAYVFSESTLDQADGPFMDLEKVARALGPVDQCAAPCVPVNLFGGPGSLTPAMLDYVTHQSRDRARHATHQVLATVAGEFPRALAGLPHPPMFSAGAEFRSASYRNRPDPLKVAGTHSEIGVQGTEGDEQVAEAFLELGVPLPGGQASTPAMELTSAARYSYHRQFGGHVSGKFGARWKPRRDLMLRATVSEGYRAPAITELHLGRNRVFQFVADPCVQWGDSEDSHLRENCQADGLPADLTQLALTPVLFGGNPELQPETARTVSAGVVFELGAGIEALADAYEVKGERFIEPLSAEGILDACYRRPPDRRALCEYMSRQADGRIAEMRSVNANSGNVRLQGVDLDLHWTLPRPATGGLGGLWKVSLSGAYLARYTVTRMAGAEEERAGNAYSGYLAYPRWRASSGLHWGRDAWAGAWYVRYIHAMTYPCDDGAQNGPANPTPVQSLAELGLCSDPDNPAGPRDRIDGVFYHDLQLSYDWDRPGYRFSFGVTNVLDRDPPPIYTAQDDSYNKSLYEPWGSRSLYLRLARYF